jgi:hypothetical protein
MLQNAGGKFKMKMMACKNKKCPAYSICRHAIAGHEKKDCGSKDDFFPCEPCKEQRRKKNENIARD